MKRAPILAALMLLGCTANAEVALEIRLASEGTVQLTFSNTGKTDKQLEFPVEGAADCDKYFDVEAIRDGEKVRKSILYAPVLESFEVKLKPGGLYVHRINPNAYLNGVEVDKLDRLRVTYTNPLDGQKSISNWVKIADKPLRATAPEKMPKDQ